MGWVFLLVFKVVLSFSRFEVGGVSFSFIYLGLNKYFFICFEVSIFDLKFLDEIFWCFIVFYDLVKVKCFFIEVLKRSYNS